MRPKIEGLETTRLKKLAPDPDGVTSVFQRIGYSLEDAIADVIDNSIDAGAKTVVLQLHRAGRRISRLTIADDGSGISPADLDRIMQFGVQLERDPSRLGRYGIGLKTASFSQCAAFSVVSKKHGQFSARRWSLELAKRDWQLEEVSASDAKAFWQRDWSPIATDAPSGTIVVWDQLQRLVPEAEHFEQSVAKLKNKLRIELGVRFHRFIETDRCRIFIREQSEGGGSVPEPVSALDPFGYGGKPGRKGYPISFRIELAGGHPFNVEAHIWPAKSNSANYKLGTGSVVKRQGFYFYRNDRLIQAGGWQGYKSEEPHSSLARVRVDLPSALDSVFQLTVQKSGCSPPPEFLQVLRHARVGNTTFAGYLETAQDVYRNAPCRIKEVAVPGPGLPRGVSAAIRKLIRERNEEAATKSFALVWKKLGRDKVVQLELSDSEVLLNSAYRSRLTGGRGDNATSAPFLALLFFALQDFLVYERAGKKLQSFERELNAFLLSTIDTKR